MNLSEAQARQLLWRAGGRRSEPFGIENVVFPPQVRWRLRTFHRVIFKNVDFQGPLIWGWPYFPIVFHDRTFLNCKFDGVNCRRVRLDRCTFQDVDFSSGKMLGSFFYTSFSNCSIRGCRLNQLIFRYCELTSSTIREAQHNGCYWRDCLWRTTVAECQMRNTSFVDVDLISVDFSHSSMIDVYFKANLAEGCKFPQGTTNFVIATENLPAAQHEVEREFPEAAKQIATYFSHANSGRRRLYSMSVEIFDESEPDEREKILTILYPFRRRNDE